MNIGAKIKIAKRAAALVQDGDRIFIDASSTSYYLAKEIKNKKITVITNAVNTVLELSGEKGLFVISTGGNLYSNHMAFFGPGARKAITQYNVNKLFFHAKAYLLTPASQTQTS